MLLYLCTYDTYESLSNSILLLLTTGKVHCILPVVSNIETKINVLNAAI